MCKLITGRQARDVVKGIIDAQEVDNSHSAYDTFMEFANRYRLDVSRQVVSETDEGKLVCSCMLIINPGATANVVLITLDDIAIAQLKFLANRIEEFDVGLIQSVISETETGKERILLKGGFRRLCSLEIMESDANINNDEPEASDDTIGWLTFTEELRERFEDAIIASYRDSLDCPELTGLRTKQEILTGHRYSGKFTPQSWWLMKYENRDAGLILLNEAVEDPKRLDLIYMAILPKFRGKGLGKLLLKQAKRCAASTGKEKIRLAVDSRNAPAIRLYGKMGFSTIQRQAVFAVLNEKRRKSINVR